MGLLVHLFSLQGEVTSPIILQILLNSAALLVSCRAAQAHTLLGQPHYACTDPLDHVLKLAEAQLHLANGLVSYSLWLQQAYVCPFGWLQCTAIWQFKVGPVRISNLRFVKFLHVIQRVPQ